MLSAARRALVTKRVRWTKAFRIISSIFPPIDLFEDTSGPEDWELLASLEAKSNPRIIEVIGQLSLVPVERRVSGPGASQPRDRCAAMLRQAFRPAAGSLAKSA